MADVVGDIHFGRPQKRIRYDTHRSTVAEEAEVGTGVGGTGDKKWLKSRFLLMARVAATRALVGGEWSCKAGLIEKSCAVGNR